YLNVPDSSMVLVTSNDTMFHIEYGVIPAGCTVNFDSSLFDVRNDPSACGIRSAKPKVRPLISKKMFNVRPSASSGKYLFPPMTRRPAASFVFMKYPAGQNGAE